MSKMKTGFIKNGWLGTYLRCTAGLKIIKRLIAKLVYKTKALVNYAYCKMHFVKCIHYAIFLQNWNHMLGKFSLGYDGVGCVST